MWCKRKSPENVEKSSMIYVVQSMWWWRDLENPGWPSLPARRPQTHNWGTFPTTFQRESSHNAKIQWKSSSNNWCTIFLRIHENIEQKQESDSWSLRVDAQLTMRGTKCTFRRAIQDIIEPQWTQHTMCILEWPILNRGHRRSSHNRKAPDMTYRLFGSHFSIFWKKQI